MPDEALDQGQTIDDLILDILADEAQIIRCLRIFFCDTLQDLSERYAHCPELKIRFADNLITAAAKKEKALAKVLEAISLFEVEPDEWIPLAPGANYPLPPVPPAITRIMFEAKTDPGMTSTLGLFITNPDFPDDQKTVDESPSTDVFIFILTPVNIISVKNLGDATIYIRNLTTE